MNAHPYLTVHTLTALPWHNLNRDENGAPKQVTEGGVTRTRLSSQSLKRAARVAFERSAEAAEESVRTKLSATIIADRVAEIRGTALTGSQRSALAKSIGLRVGKLTHGSDKESKKETLVWLSAREVEQVAQAFAKDNDAQPDVVTTSTDSLAIAAFGRMFAAAPELCLPSAISVGDAITTHAATVELDWFAAVDDRAEHGGAGQLGFTMQTTGVYYRAFTFDRAQLARNFDQPLGSDSAEPQLRSLIRHLTLALPSGRRAGTAAQALPALIMAEEQAHRVHYDFHTPVDADTDGGFLVPSMEALGDKMLAARAFDPEMFGDHVISGTHPAAMPVPFAEYTDFVLDFLRS